jgi:hypothetical protein
MVVAGLALAVGLEQFVLDENDNFNVDWISLQTLLFMIFATTVARFVHGAMRTFDRSYTEQPQTADWRIWQPLIDFLGLGIEAFIFFLLAYSIADSSRFIEYYLMLLLADILWLVVISLPHISGLWSGNKKWWIIADLLVLIPTGSSIAAVGIGIYPMWLVWVFIGGVAFHTVMDYPKNSEFYFGQSFKWPWSVQAVVEVSGRPGANAANNEISLVFIAGAYKGADFNEVDKNIQLAEQYSIEMWNRGYKVFCAHLNTSHFEVKARADESAYKEFDLRILECCDAVFALPNWEASVGAKAEIKKAQQLGKPVFYSLDDLPARK